VRPFGKPLQPIHRIFLEEPRRFHYLLEGWIYHGESAQEWNAFPVAMMNFDVDFTACGREFPATGFPIFILRRIGSLRPFEHFGWYRYDLIDCVTATGPEEALGAHTESGANGNAVEILPIGVQGIFVDGRERCDFC
jgi:hypothetical protein